MKKIISSIIFVIITNTSVFAVTSIKIMKEDLNTKHSRLIVDWKKSYNNYLDILQKIQKKLDSGDYKILWLLTWTSMDTVSVHMQDWYKSLIKKLTDDKYSIIAKIDILDNKFQLKLVWTWDYRAQMQELESSISSFPQTWKKYISSFENNLSGTVSTFNKSIESKLKELSSEVAIYRNFDSQLKSLKHNYQTMNKKSSEIKNIVWISKNSLDKASTEIKKYANDYFSWYVEWKYQKQLSNNSDIAYFEKERKNKKDLILWFVDKKVSDVIKEVTENYYPNIDTSSLKKSFDEINKLDAKIVVKNPSVYTDKLKIANSTTIDYISQLTKKLSKFKNINTESNKKVFEIVKKDVLEWIRNISPIVDQELNESFSLWIGKIKKKATSESARMWNALVEYNQKMSKATSVSINELIRSLNKHKASISLPSNLLIISKYIQAAEDKLKQIKYKDMLDNINNLKKTVDWLQASETSKIQSLKSQLDGFTWKKEFQEKISEIKFNLRLKENLNKLYKAWAVRYLYNYWDLSDSVWNILKRYYLKYQKSWKSKAFEQKIKRAYKKIDKLMAVISNDKKSYYIVMIYNGLLKFDREFNIWK